MKMVMDFKILLISFASKPLLASRSRFSTVVYVSRILEIHKNIKI